MSCFCSKHDPPIPDWLMEFEVVQGFFAQNDKDKLSLLSSLVVCHDLMLLSFA